MKERLIIAYKYFKNVNSFEKTIIFLKKFRLLYIEILNSQNSEMIAISQVMMYTSLFIITKHQGMEDEANIMKNKMYILKKQYENILKEYSAY